MNKRLLLIVMLLLVFVVAKPVHAFSIEKLPNFSAAGDFIIGPGKTELRLNAGDRDAKNINVTNRYGTAMDFKIEIEDFAGSSNPEDALVLLGGEKGPYSLRDFLHPEVFTFRLNQGERITIPVVVNIPQDAQPGGLYGAVIITTQPIANNSTADQNSTKGNITIVSRVASLFFVRVNGDVLESGKLLSFTADKNYYTEPKINYRFLYQNDGSVYLNPYGLLTVKNIIGTEIEQIQISPYFVMPGSVRQKDINMSRSLMFGRYSATLQLNRGYSDVIDTKTIYFWVLPWKQVILSITALFGLIVIFKLVSSWFSRNFEIKRKG
ncbi:MAG: hypothetical protein WCV83_03255 [Candidatus Magasanikbacteria bacterium]|jgi:hypothetical protein